MRVRTASMAALTAPLAAVLLLAGCSSNDASGGGAASSAAGTTVSSAPTAAAAQSTAAATSGGGTGSIAITGKYTGKLVPDGCTENGAIVDVVLDGHPTPTSGTVTAHYWGFNGPDAQIFTPVRGSARPTLSGKTYTVDNIKLSFRDQVVTANGSITCP